MATYSDTQIAEAIKKAKGNPTKARANLIAMAADDQRLLLSLVKSYLPAIATQAINHYSSQAVKKRAGAEDLMPLPKAPKNSPGGFGLDLLKALGGQNVPKFGREDAAPPLRKKAASQQHVDALKMMASKSKTKPRT